MPRRSSDYWISQYKKNGALWIREGTSKKRPHALLTSGKHSSGFFNSEIVMEDPCLLDHACSDLINLLELNVSTVDRVVGPAMGAITFAHEIARQISHQRYRGLPNCLRAYTEKEVSSDGKLMVFNRTTIRSGERVLLCEDVFTTGDSVDLTATAVIKAGGIVLPFVVTLVNRSGFAGMRDRKIISLIDRSMPMWPPEECPLCKEGSKAIRPKGKENWTLLLNAVY